jgi:hypothetical protein
LSTGVVSAGKSSQPAHESEFAMSVLYDETPPDRNVIPFNGNGPLASFVDARRALAAATTVTQVKAVLAAADGLIAAARTAADREIEAEAAALRLEAERRLGQLMKMQAETVGLNQGGRPKTRFPKNPVDQHPDDRPTLAEAGIDKNLAHRARVAAAMPEPEFKEAVEAKREAVRAPKPVPKGWSRTRWERHRGKKRAKNKAEEPAKPGAARSTETVEEAAATIDTAVVSTSSEISPANAAELERLRAKVHELHRLLGAAKAEADDAKAEASNAKTEVSRLKLELGRAAVDGSAAKIAARCKKIIPFLDHSPQHADAIRKLVTEILHLVEPTAKASVSSDKLDHKALGKALCKSIASTGSDGLDIPDFLLRETKH